MITLTISRKSLFLRFFLWVWSADPEKLDGCKLFWGTIFSPVALALKQRIYHFVPGLSLFYFFGAVILALLRQWVSAFIWIILAFGFCLFGYIAAKKGKKGFVEESSDLEERRKQQDKEQLEQLEFNKKMDDWLFKHPRIEWCLEKLFDTIGRLIDSTIVTIFSEYLRAIKKHSCPLVKVV